MGQGKVDAYEEITMKFIPLYNQHVEMVACCYSLEEHGIFAKLKMV